MRTITILVLVTSLLTGCAGLKLSAETAISRIDEQQSSNRTYRGDTIPLRCMFWGCDKAVQADSEAS